MEEEEERKGEGGGGKKGGGGGGRQKGEVRGKGKIVMEGKGERRSG